MRKRILDKETLRLNGIISASLRKAMELYHDGEKPGIGPLNLAIGADVGIGSVRSILNDPEHCTSVRVLNRLATYLGYRPEQFLTGELLDKQEAA